MAVGFGEKGSFERLIEALRHGQEAATELGIHRDQAEWMAVSTLLQQVQHKVTALASNAAMQRAGIMRRG